MSLNIDGLPLSKSSKEQLWPIQCTIYSCGPDSLASKPFVITAFVGPSKPENANDFLKPLVCELKEVLEEGIQLCGKQVNVQLKNIICDAPARALVLKTKEHSIYNVCPKCTAEGGFYKKVYFSATAGAPRTDDLFWVQSNMEHHVVGVSILTELPIDYITIAHLDPMHLVYLGVARKLVNLWLSGPLPVRVGPADRDEMSRKSCALHNYVPEEFM